MEKVCYSKFFSNPKQSPLSWQLSETSTSTTFTADLINKSFQHRTDLDPFGDFVQNEMPASVFRKYSFFSHCGSFSLISSSLFVLSVCFVFISKCYIFEMFSGKTSDENQQKNKKKYVYVWFGIEISVEMQAKPKYDE